MSASSITGTVMFGTALLGATAGSIGTFAVLRRRALVGDMLSHAALPGICIAFMLIGHRDLVFLSLGALTSGLVGVAVMTFIRRWTRTKEDAAIGIVLSTFFGMGIVLLSVIQQLPAGNQAGLETYFFGETAGITLHDIRLIAGTAVVCLLLILLLYKEFELLSFDPEFATAQGWPTLALDLGMMSALAVVTIVGLPICGVILMAALIILPGAAARFWTNRLGRLLLIAAVIGGLSGVIGTFLASPLPEKWFGRELMDSEHLPPGPLIVLAASGVFVCSMLFSPQRGIVARTLAELRLRARVVRDHLLRGLYELTEDQLPERPYFDEAEILAQRAWNQRWLRFWMSRLAGKGLIDRRDGRLRLTPSGLEAAAEVTRTHRLWELFLVESAGIAEDHVDRDADDMEHMLPAPLLRELEGRLAASGRLPAAAVPRSPHDLS